MAPKQPAELTAVLIEYAFSGVYGRVTTLARQHGVPETALAELEQAVLSAFEGDMGFAHEFREFEVEPVIAAVRQRLATAFEEIATGRREALGERGGS